MGLFSKNPNEAMYNGGKKHFTDVIKNDGAAELLVWRALEEDFNTHSVLVVNPGEKAVFVNNGTVEQVFENGRYQLSTENYPFISRLRNAFSGGISSFHCLVYFFRGADSEELFWGTPSPITVRDKVWGIRTDARARGSYKIRITNPAQLLQKLVGSNVALQTQQELYKYFDSEFQSKIKTAISKFLNSLEQELIGLDAYLDDLSQQAMPVINEVVSEYGLECVRFSIAGLDIDTTKYDAIDEAQVAGIQTGKLAQAEALRKVTEAQGDLGVMQTLGENWGRQKAVDILDTLAANPGAGGAASAGAGVGMGMAAGGVFGNLAGQVFAPMNGVANGMQPTGLPAQPAVTPPPTGPAGRFGVAGSTPAPAAALAPAAGGDTWTCACGNSGIVGNFCNMCGAKRPAPQPASDTWNCACGNSGIVGNFCNMCGAKRPANDPNAPWNCTCGNTGIVGMFCNQCGKKKGV